MSKYSSPPDARLAGRLDQSPRACDYPPRPAPLPGLRHDFADTAGQFP